MQQQWSLDMYQTCNVFAALISAINYMLHSAATVCYRTMAFGIEKRAESSIETKEPVLLDCGGDAVDWSLVVHPQ